MMESVKWKMDGRGGKQRQRGDKITINDPVKAGCFSMAIGHVLLTSWHYR
jgi:hypothetical protein